MSLFSRFLLVNAILGLALAAQWGLHWHISSGAELVYPHIRKPLSEFPLAFPTNGNKSAEGSAGWVGKTNPYEELIRKQLPYTPDNMISRTYGLTDSPLALYLYMVHSRQADDRKHHPEICIRDVTGAPEDLDARKILYLDAENKRPIQRFRFRTSSTQHTVVYYWHLTFPRVPVEGETPLQVAHQRGTKSAPSVTVQVSTTAEVEQLDPIEQDFLVKLDQTLRAEYLPEGTVMGCDRTPIALMRR